MAKTSIKKTVLSVVFEVKKTVFKALGNLGNLVHKSLHKNRPFGKTFLVLLFTVSIGVTSADQWVYAKNLPVSTQQNVLSELPVAAPALTVQKVLQETCQARGYNESCGKLLLGMLWKESQNDAKALGDNGRARGYFQIHYKLHGISIACAENLECSAAWTLSYLEQNGYPKNVMCAVQCHNGCNAGNGYAASVRRLGDRLWSNNLPVTVAFAK